MENRIAGHQVVVIGVSAGGMAVLSELLPAFPATYSLPIVVVQHLHPLQDRSFIQHFDHQSALTVKEADEKESIEAGHVYIAPPNYHLLIENDRTFSLSVDEKVNYARPAIDVLFESAADVYGDGVIGVILTGANDDGARGLRSIKARGGLAIVQDPETAEAPAMPQAAIAATHVDHVLALPEIARLLSQKG
ncbi:MAG: chemotaxis protein CheB [Anaerolineae bacterium]|nr:chemotaxis protein CheB [Anaerolineae bacterium]